MACSHMKKNEAFHCNYSTEIYRQLHENNTRTLISLDSMYKIFLVSIQKIYSTTNKRTNLNDEWNATSCIVLRIYMRVSDINNVFFIVTTDLIMPLKLTFFIISLIKLYNFECQQVSFRLFLIKLIILTSFQRCFSGICYSDA